MPRTPGLHDLHRDRIRKKMIENSDALHDHEVLEIILFKDTPRKDTNETAHLLLKKFGSLQNVLNADYRDLEAVPGVTKNAALHITAMRLFFDRVRRQTSAATVISSFGEAENYLRAHLGSLPREQCLLVLLSAAGKVIHTKALAIGGFMGVKFETRPIIDEAVRANAAKVLLAHNHPSGNYLPAPADKDATKLLIRALDAAQIQLLDHIIISENGAYSFLLG